MSGNKEMLHAKVVYLEFWWNVSVYDMDVIKVDKDLAWIIEEDKLGIWRRGFEINQYPNSCVETLQQPTGTSMTNLESLIPGKFNLDFLRTDHQISIPCTVLESHICVRPRFFQWEPWGINCVRVPGNGRCIPCSSLLYHQHGAGLNEQPHSYCMQFGPPTDTNDVDFEDDIFHILLFSLSRLSCSAHRQYMKTKFWFPYVIW